MNEKTIVGTIESCVVFRSGQTNGRDWAIYHVVIDGQKLSTFDGGYAKLIGKQGEWKYKEEEKNGYINKTLTELPKASPWDAIKQLQVRVTAVEQHLGLGGATIAPNPTGTLAKPAMTIEQEAAQVKKTKPVINAEGYPEINVEDDIAPEDLPF